MARMARIVAPGVAHHITQRGNRRQPVFFLEADYEYYRSLLVDWSRRFDLAVVCYCLMPNHVHLIVVPPDQQSLALTVREIHQRYTRAINFRENWRGHLWQGRFASFPLSEQHLYHAVRYVEMNPVRAELVTKPEQWRWSSAKDRMCPVPDFLVDDAWLRKHGIAGQSHTHDVDVELFRRHERTGRPIGDDAFIGKLEHLCHRSLVPQKPGPKSKQS